MVGSSLGRHDLPEDGQLGRQARRPAKARNGEVRKPGTSLALVAADRLQPAPNRLRHAGRFAAFVLEDEHADAPRLAVAAEHELHWPGALDGAADDLEDRLDFEARPPAEEGDGEMELLRRNEARPTSGQLRQLPGGEPFAVVGRKRVGDEEAYSLIAAYASARIHA